MVCERHRLKMRRGLAAPGSAVNSGNGLSGFLSHFDAVSVGNSGEAVGRSFRLGFHFSSRVATAGNEHGRHDGEDSELLDHLRLLFW